MMDPIRRTILTTGAVATAMAAAPRAFAREAGQGVDTMGTYEKARFASALRKQAPAFRCC